METTHHLDLSGENAYNDFRETIKDIDFAMLTTWDGNEMRSRPMSTQEMETDGELWFFTRIQSGKVNEIETYDKVNVSYSDPKTQRYVSVAGSAHIHIDPAKARELWSPHVEAWFKGPDDPELALVCVTIQSAESWGADGQSKQLIGLMRPAIMGHPYPPGKSMELTTSKAHLNNGERRI